MCNVATAELWAGHADQQFGPYTFSQHGEDLILANLFHHIGVATPSYLDVGAHHPLNISNTAFFYRRGSRGVNVEANPDLIGPFKELRPDDITLNVGVGGKQGIMPFYRVDNWSGRNSFSKQSVERFISESPSFKIDSVISVPVVTLDYLADHYCSRKFPDLLSMDIEGLEMEVLGAADFRRTSPSLVCIEVGAERHKDAQGRIAITDLMSDKGFDLVFRTSANWIFAHQRHRAQLEF